MVRPTAVVTGASRGIGRAIALRLARTHAIVAVARHAGDLQALASDIVEAGGECRPVPIDITDGDAVARALADIDAKVLVNNAGVGALKPFMELRRDEWRGMVDLNFAALYDVTRALVPGMIRRRSGHVVMIGSIAARGAFIGGSCYAATKHAVAAFSECLMLELRDAGVKVSVVNPGSVATDFSDRRADGSWALDPDDVAEAVARVIDTPSNVLVYQVEVRPLRVPK